MTALIGVAAEAALLLVCGSCRFNTARAAAESSDPFVRMADVEQKRQLVLDEIERLGPIIRGRVCIAATGEFRSRSRWRRMPDA
jgi:hypothetical protein